MEQPATTLASASHSADVPQVAHRTFPHASTLMLLLAAAGIPISLLWDFSWESTVGIDLVWSAAHTATYLAVALAGATAISFIGMATGQPSAAFTGVRLGPLQAPLGAWIALWGAAAFLRAVLFY